MWEKNELIKWSIQSPLVTVVSHLPLQDEPDPVVCDKCPFFH